MTIEQQEPEELLRDEEAQLHRRLKAYEELVRLGREREGLKTALTANIAETVGVVRDAEPDIEMAKAASVAGISRATLYRWLRLHC